MRFAACLLVAFACSGALASEPGTPIDCSDLIWLLPGYSCSLYMPHDPTPNWRTWMGGKGANEIADNEGHLVALHFTYIEPFTGDAILTRARTSLVRTNGQNEETIGYFEDRAYGPARDHLRPVFSFDFQQARGEETDHGGLSIEPIVFDAVNGRLLIPVRSLCSPCGNPGYVEQRVIFVISGFAPLFEILQSYTPQPSALSFHVPVRPEGMAGSDSFDTYWGPLTKPLDFTQAHPLQCNYPAAAPHVGDYLTVPDTVPTPAPSQGVYYFTSATYQGATRYGRKTTAGHLTGRDPALLPACTP